MANHVQVNLGLPAELLAKIETNIKGKCRNAKLLKCVEVGYKALTNASCKESTTPTERSAHSG